MTMQHGTQPKTKANKDFSDDHKERKRGVKPVLPPRDGTTRTKGVSQRHRAEDRDENKNEVRSNQ